ncbi:uncharacterized protein LOC135963688 [Calliphora vicina]|uniref:uncharacterized protein LOC135963688 n=1 Tax=Calliphora vicina TaxID=7373 RepID=UPI00325C07AD
MKNITNSNNLNQAGNFNAFNNNHHDETSETVAENPKAQAYLNHLLNDGCNEGDSGYEMELPYYYNDKLFRQGQSYLAKYRFVLLIGMLSGLVGVLAIPSILKVLICTRQSGSPKAAYRRYVRTILHTLAWYNYSPTPRTSKFWISLEGVRNAHSRSSRACAKLGAGQISQKDLALTQFGFIGFLTLGAHRIQLYDEEFLEATSHMWRVIGYLLGIKDEYNICGENWSETKLRLDIVMRKVYEPALENTSKDFEKMCKALLDGLWPVNISLTAGSFLYMTKRLAYVKGYEYYDFDYRPGTKPDPNQYRYYKDLSWWDRVVVFWGLLVLTYLHKYNIVRWFLNFGIWVNEKSLYYLPYIAVFKFGIKWAYVRVFKGSEVKPFDFHLKEEY